MQLNVKLVSLDYRSFHFSKEMQAEDLKPHHSNSDLQQKS